ncbi:hypothetical protein PtA15_4A522 [Puccinia triticina]|uniref:Gamma tubulin complex component C-terminal domain-containing protein n=1 Tax=Puccinia triticina TaxID=208348 RepID=A0ABY7CIX1_9BASI|nr:uncharacterized protein PtA15_4A522 [Puccinia triticina]WAQ84071.1 hypothetical protein PtA15_4A522 [Puccinia triticina]WAR54908.1 hypothetical protein PtB15_4B526 [Puccinia triticina]
MCAARAGKAHEQIYLNHQLKIKSPISNKRLLLNRPNVHMLEPSLHESGWDVFMLKYKTEHPLDLTLSVAAMENYLRMSRVLLKTNRLKQSLDRA